MANLVQKIGALGIPFILRLVIIKARIGRAESRIAIQLLLYHLCLRLLKKNTARPAREELHILSLGYGFITVVGMTVAEYFIGKHVKYFGALGNSRHIVVQVGRWNVGVHDNEATGAG